MTPNGLSDGQNRFGGTHLHISHLRPCGESTVVLVHAMKAIGGDKGIVPFIGLGSNCQFRGPNALSPGNEQLGPHIRSGRFGKQIYFAYLKSNHDSSVIQLVFQSLH